MNEILTPSDLEVPSRAKMKKLTLGIDLARAVDVPSEPFIIFHHFSEHSNFAPTGTGRRDYFVPYLRFIEGDRMYRGDHFIHTSSEAICRMVARLPSESTGLKARVVQRQSQNSEDRTYYELIDSV